MYFQRHLRFGRQVLATIYSLPLVFLLWSAGVFAGAFMLFSVFASLAGNIAFGVVAGIIALGIASTIGFFWHAADDTASVPHVFQSFWWACDAFKPWRWTTCLTRSRAHSPSPGLLPCHSRN